MLHRSRVMLLAFGLALAGCASKPSPIALITTLPPAPLAVAALPPGASPGMAIPAMLADGSYPTPNRDLSPAAALWHLRAGLNVAALACRGGNETTIIARYNTVLATNKVALAKAEATLAAEYRNGGGDWRDRYDDAMTRLYNYFSLSPARTGFCAAADQVLADTVAVPPEALPEFAMTRLAELDRPFTDFYRAYDAWRGRAMPMQRPIEMAMRDTPRRPVIALNAAVVAPQPERVRPRLELDPSVFLEP